MGVAPVQIHVMSHVDGVTCRTRPPPTGNITSRTTGVIDLPNCMSKLLGYGMSVSQAVGCVTANAARAFPVFKDRGLRVGAPADVALLELRDGDFEFLDNYTGTIKGGQRFFPVGTVLGGKRVPRA
jgi:dihydroorotase